MEIEIKVEQFSTVLTLKKWSYKLLHSWQKKFLRFSMVFFWSAECTLPSNGSKKRNHCLDFCLVYILYTAADEKQGFIFDIVCSILNQISILATCGVVTMLA